MGFYVFEGIKSAAVVTSKPRRQLLVHMRVDPVEVFDLFADDGDVNWACYGVSPTLMEKFNLHQKVEDMPDFTVGDVAVILFQKPSGEITARVATLVQLPLPAPHNMTGPTLGDIFANALGQ